MYTTWYWILNRMDGLSLSLSLPAVEPPLGVGSMFSGCLHSREINVNHSPETQFNRYTVYIVHTANRDTWKPIHVDFNPPLTPGSNNILSTSALYVGGTWAGGSASQNVCYRSLVFNSFGSIITLFCFGVYIHVQLQFWLLYHMLILSSVLVPWWLVVN